uniref:Protein kinase domain-containing protein n=1 Tax=Parascaris univalens TaxID=6257 RepID=A0A915A1M6_PARUN
SKAAQEQVQGEEGEDGEVYEKEDDHVLTCTYEFVTFLRQQGIYFRRTRSGIGGGSDERTNAELRPGPMPSETTSAAPLSASPASSTPAVEWVRGRQRNSDRSVRKMFVCQCSLPTYTTIRQA